MEPTNGSEERFVRECDENPVDSGRVANETGCSVTMRSFEKCLRPLHFAGKGVDETPLCLMHSSDPDKCSGPLFEAFWQEFWRILRNAGENWANFESFVFPRLEFSFWKFEAKCQFTHAKFTQKAMFENATFSQYVDFVGATFRDDACFNKTTFEKGASFKEAAFIGRAQFQSVRFGSQFGPRVDFRSADFSLDAEFDFANFEFGADFGSTTFGRRASFVGSKFQSSDADFNLVIFKDAARFEDAKFDGPAIWRGSRFLGAVEFRRTKFENRFHGEPDASFALASFCAPDYSVFDDVDLSRSLFHNCDVSKVWFTSSVRWARRRGKRGFVVFDETIPLEFFDPFDPRDATGLIKFKILNGSSTQMKLITMRKRDYGLLAQTYQQLKKNYDFRLDYWSADEFHFAEMEMKRLAVPTEGALIGLRQWLHRRLSLVALYRYGSDYGNSYWKPLLWLIATIALIAILLPLPGVGLKRQGTNHPENYVSVWMDANDGRQKLWQEVRLVGKGTIASLDTITFQRTSEYAPAYPWGRVLSILETLASSTLVALFLLAIRRQFRR